MRYPQQTQTTQSSMSSSPRLCRGGLWLTLIAMGLFSGLVQGQNQMVVVVHQLQQQQVKALQADQDMRAGVAAALASTQLVQAHQPGQQVMSISGGGWQGQGGQSIGWSGVSTTGDVVWNTHVSGGGAQQGVAAGVGYQF